MEPVTEVPFSRRSTKQQKASLQNNWPHDKTCQDTFSTDVADDKSVTKTEFNECEWDIYKSTIP